MNQPNLIGSLLMTAVFMSIGPSCFFCLVTCLVLSVMNGSLAVGCHLDTVTKQKKHDGPIDMKTAVFSSSKFLLVTVVY